MNNFGGDWTQQKIEIVVDYAKAYLTIMNKYPQFKTIYFDGFAGSGEISKELDETNIEIIKGTAIRILEINQPKSFDIYYFVEKNEKNKADLEKTINENFGLKRTHVVNEDCNNKLMNLAEYLKKHGEYKVLAFVDPYGMSVNWDSLKSLKGLGVDLWILVPTGMGVNRLLKRDYNISEAWLLKLERFLGLERSEILEYFYKKTSFVTLFGEETLIQKQEKAIEKAGELYKKRLTEIFKFVSDPFLMRISTGGIMYHFMMASNNPAALKIANDIIKPKYK